VAKELYADEFGVITLIPEEGVLELEWLEGSANMTDEDFMRSMERYANLAEERRPANLLVDVTKFRHTPGESVGPWRDEHVIPRYNAAGVRKFAFLFPPGVPGTVESGKDPEREPPGEFPTGYFEDRRHILEWFRASQPDI
jgi:hypothetical protein